LGVARGSQRASLKCPGPKRRPLASERLKIITSQIEHKGILAACEQLEKENFEIVRLPVLKNGLVDLEFLKKALDQKTILVSITMADSETGTIQPISEISRIIRDFRESRIMNYELSKKNSSSQSHNSYPIIHNLFPLLHTDASQAAGYLNLDVNKLGVDLMTLSAHKIYGPKGIGGLFVRRGTKINPIIYGGGQGAGLRSGTENVPVIVGFAKALELNFKNKKKENARVKKLRDALEKGILKTIPKVMRNGHTTLRLPNFLNVSILDIEGEAMLLYLDEIGIMVATGSACNSQNLEPSYILSALGRSYDHIHGSLRFTLGHETTQGDVKYVLKNLPEVVKKLREISPLNLNSKT
jgi:cysteine desulfurase